MTRGDFLERWLAGDSLAVLASECSGTPEQILRDEVHAMIGALDAAHTARRETYRALDTAMRDACTAVEHDPYWRGFDLGRADALQTAASIAGATVQATVRRGAA